VYGYLGPNGAGKTTTLRMALGLITPDAGTVELFGRDPLVEGVGALDGVAGFVEAPRFYPYLTGRTNLELVAALDGGDAATRIDAALDVVELADRSRDKVGGYSHGMRQRLGLAGALLRDPRLLILDEPATGLDPGGMRDMRRLIRRLADDGMTVLLSSHLMAEVEELCDRVVIISSGRVRYEGALADLIATTSGRYELRTTDDDRAAAIARAQRGIENTARDARGLSFIAEEPAAAALSIALGEAGIGIAALVPRTATLEELFFRMTEEDAAEPAPVPAPASAAEAVRA
jgi:ABC-2 type transport system ATP-binding protein